MPAGRTLDALSLLRSVFKIAGHPAVQDGTVGLNSLQRKVGRNSAKHQLHSRRWGARRLPRSQVASPLLPLSPLFTPADIEGISVRPARPHPMEEHHKDPTCRDDLRGDRYHYREGAACRPRSGPAHSQDNQDVRWTGERAQ